MNMWANLFLSIAKLFGYSEEPLPKPPPPTSTKRMERGALHRILNLAAPKAKVYTSDRSFLLCKKDDVKRFLEWDKTNRVKYVAEALDCDDFAYRLLGQISIPEWSDLAFGMVWTNRHALNCFVDEDGVMYFVEPQSDKIQTKLEDWQGTTVSFIIM